jgi:hypothetical protein
MKDLEAVVCITIIASSVLIGGGVGYYRYVVFQSEFYL